MPICPHGHFSRFDPKVPHFIRYYPRVATSTGRAVRAWVANNACTRWTTTSIEPCYTVPIRRRTLSRETCGLASEEPKGRLQNRVRFTLKGKNNIVCIAKGTYRIIPRV